MPESLSHADTYLATERTFLAWVRTSLAVLGFGLAFARFFPVTVHGVEMSNLIAGCAIISSLILLINCTTRYYVTVDEILRNDFDWDPAGPALLFVMVLGLILAPAFLGGRKEIMHRRKLKEAAAAGDTSYGEAHQGSDDGAAGQYAALRTQLLPGENNMSSAEAVAKLDEIAGLLRTQNAALQELVKASQRTQNVA